MRHPKLVSKSLSRVYKIAKKNKANIVKAKDILRSDRELLIQTNWLFEIIRGWYLLVRPDVNNNDSTVWYANFRDFLRLYLNDRFGENYCLCAINSLELHSNKPTIPKKVIVIAHKGSVIDKILPFNTSLLIYPGKNISKNTKEIKGLKVMSLPFLLCKLPSIFFKKNPFEVELALKLIKNSKQLSTIIIKNNFKEAANRLIGAYLFLKDEDMAKNIKKDLEKEGMKISIKNPFSKIYSSYLTMQTSSSHVNRLIILWENYRKVIIKEFKKEKLLKLNKKTNILKKIKDIYKQDSYHSLSIEGYEISLELIELVKSNKWNPDLNIKERNILAAKGYFEAFKKVENSIKKILKAKNAGAVVAKDLQTWFLNLFSPSIKSGILLKKDLLGYRRSQVFIRGSRHVPYPREALIDSMETFFYLLKKEKDAIVRAILGHFIFVYIHPYMDGNGRIARFLMNSMLISGNYPWTIIHVENRKEYMSALEKASTENNIKPFIKLIKKEMLVSKKRRKTNL